MNYFVPLLYKVLIIFVVFLLTKRFLVGVRITGHDYVIFQVCTNLLASIVNQQPSFILLLNNANTMSLHLAGHVIKINYSYLHELSGL